MSEHMLQCLNEKEASKLRDVLQKVLIPELKSQISRGSCLKSFRPEEEKGVDRLLWHVPGAMHRTSFKLPWFTRPETFPAASRDLVIPWMARSPIHRPTDLVVLYAPLALEGYSEEAARMLTAIPTVDGSGLWVVPCANIVLGRDAFVKADIPVASDTGSTSFNNSDSVNSSNNFNFNHASPFCFSTEKESAFSLGMRTPSEIANLIRKALGLPNSSEGHVFASSNWGEELPAVAPRPNLEDEAVVEALCMEASWFRKCGPTRWTEQLIHEIELLRQDVSGPPVEWLGFVGSTIGSGLWRHEQFQQRYKDAQALKAGKDMKWLMTEPVIEARAACKLAFPCMQLGPQALDDDERLMGMHPNRVTGGQEVPGEQGLFAGWKWLFPDKCADKYKSWLKHEHSRKLSLPNRRAHCLVQQALVECRMRGEYRRTKAIHMIRIALPVAAFQTDFPTESLRPSAALLHVNLNTLDEVGEHEEIVKARKHRLLLTSLRLG
jgi:hypothetical protein